MRSIRFRLDGITFSSLLSFCVLTPSSNGLIPSVEPQLKQKQRVLPSTLPPQIRGEWEEGRGGRRWRGRTRPEPSVRVVAGRC